MQITEQTYEPRRFDCLKGACALALVCRRLGAIAQPVIFAEITVRTAEHARRICDVLEARDDLARAVRSVVRASLTMSTTSHAPGAVDEAREMLVRILSLTKRLRSYLSDVGAAEEPETPTGAIVCVATPRSVRGDTCASLECCATWGDPVQLPLSQWPSVRHRRVRRGDAGRSLRRVRRPRRRSESPRARGQQRGRRHHRLILRCSHTSGQPLRSIAALSVVERPFASVIPSSWILDICLTSTRSLAQRGSHWLSRRASRACWALRLAFAFGCRRLVVLRIVSELLRPRLRTAWAAGRGCPRDAGARLPSTSRQKRARLRQWYGRSPCTSVDDAQTQARLLDMPDDVLTSIAEESYSWLPGLGPLRALALVNRRWRAIAQPVLFAEVAIDTVDDACQLDAVLSTRPDLARAVRGIRRGPGLQVDETDGDVTRDQLVRILRRTMCLRSYQSAVPANDEPSRPYQAIILPATVRFISIYDFDPSALLDLMIFAKPEVLVVDGVANGCPLRVSQLPDIARAASRLRALWLRWTEMEPRVDSLEAATQRAQAGNRIELDDPWGPPLARALVDASAPTLQEVRQYAAAGRR